MADYIPVVVPLSEHIKPDPLRAPTMAEIERARDMYAQGFTVARCLAAAPMSLGTLYYWLDGGPCDERGQAMLPPIPRRRSIVSKRRKPLSASTASLIARLTRTAERAALEIEQRLARPAGATPERERDLRMLASLVQSLRGLAALSPAGDAAARKADDNDPVPEDIDAFRLALGRRIEAFVAAKREQEAAERAAQAEPDVQGEPLPR